VEREFSAGGVLVRRMRGRWWLAAIRPQGKPPGTWALPKGVIDAGERGAETAVREVAEETGLTGRLEGKLGDVRYVYTRRGGVRVFKVVSFFLLHYAGGRIGELPPGMEREVAEARWLPLEEAPRLLAYGGERQMAEQAIAAVKVPDATEP
jgi:8-oxo-dGTP pyrophosphatase MutT (NUDIX family)